MLTSVPMHGDGFGVHGPMSDMPTMDEVMEPELDFEADLRAQDAWRESQLLQETGGLGSMTRGLMRPGGRHTIVCKHWLRDLCMKGDKCDFLHQYDLARMPECLQWARFGKCPENDCDFRHDTERMECQKYKFGFCKLGSQCRMRHDKIGRNHLPEAMPDWYLKELVPNIFDFVPALPEEAVRSIKQAEGPFPPAAGWNVPMIPQDAWAAPPDAWAVPAKPMVDLTEPPRTRTRERVRDEPPRDEPRPRGDTRSDRREDVRREETRREPRPRSRGEMRPREEPRPRGEIRSDRREDVRREETRRLEPPRPRADTRSDRREDTDRRDARPRDEPVRRRAEIGSDRREESRPTRRDDSRHARETRRPDSRNESSRDDTRRRSRSRPTRDRR